MIDQNCHSNNNQSSVGLFVAGLPSQVNHLSVLDHFMQIAPCFSLPRHEDKQYLERHSKKGCCTLLCYDAKVARGLLDARFHEFMGRTLTIMEHKSGVELIIQNKKLKKSRVDLKKVPWYIGEKDLRFLLEANFGPLQLIYQLRNQDPIKSLHTRAKAKSSKYHTFSAYFLDSRDARKLLQQGTIRLEDGSVILAQKHAIEYFGSKQPNDSHALPKFPRDAQGRVWSSSGEAGCKHDHRELETKYESGARLRHLDSSENHLIKPTQKAYYTLEHVGDWRILRVSGKSGALYRLNSGDGITRT